MQNYLLIPALFALLALPGATTPAPRLQANPPVAPLVDLDARDSTAGTESWADHGSLGPFTRVGHPTLGKVAGVVAVSFDGRQDAYLGPDSAPALEGAHPRTIEVWVYNPTLDSAEETMVSWGRRGGPNASMLAFGYGSSGAYGAATHWADDLGWEGVPKPAQWHQLVYTYDGHTARIYDNTAEKNSREVRLNTLRTPISLAAETGADGKLQFRNEYDHSQQAGSLWLASVRIYDTALTPDQIATRFQQEAPRFGVLALPTPAALLKDGMDHYEAGGLALTLLRATQTPANLTPVGDTFDFLPGDRLTRRLGDRYVQLGDITLRLRTAGGDWKGYDSANERTRLTPTASPNALTACDLTPALGADCPLTVERLWVKQGNELVMRFLLRNKTQQPVEIGAFGAAMVFNNLLSGRRIEEAYAKCAFADPAITGQAGYLQVTRLRGEGNALLVLPETGTSFEAYRQLREDPTPRDVTFEGFYEWMVHTRAYAENEWKNAQPWNPPTSRTLPAGGEATYGFRFVLAPEIRKIEQTLLDHEQPVAVGIPGYVVSTDQPARLFLHTGRKILHAATPMQVSVEPAGAILFKPDASPTPQGWNGYTLTAKQVGRCRVTVTYPDGTTQNLAYNVIPPEMEQVKRLGAYHAAHQWYTDPKDPFGRTFSFMPVNRETGKMVLQHSHTWMSGLSDEMGAGPSVAMAMKNLEQPDAAEIALLEKYADTTLWGKLQYPNYGVRASLFFYEPALLPPGYYTIRDGWDRARTETTWRAFNYPHVAAVYWALYRLARDHKGLVKTHLWDWYLKQAAETGIAMYRQSGGRGGLGQFGLMVGSVFPEILKDLRREQMTAEADRFETVMKERADGWRQREYPFGSEMPWDSTGQEEIYTWCRYFGFDDKAEITLNAILGYMPTVPNWAYNGAARRYFDAPVNGTRWPEIGRMTNHYGSSLNAIPVLAAYRDHPDDLYLLRIGYAGMDQILANIDADGHGSYGFDANPAILQFDPYTADYGIAFYGYAYSAGAYVLQHPEFGWLGFGAEVKQQNGKVEITPRDAFRQRVYLAPVGLWLTLDAGRFEKIDYDPKTQKVEVTLAPATSDTPFALLRVEAHPQADHPARIFTLTPQSPKERDAYAIPLTDQPTHIQLHE